MDIYITIALDGQSTTWQQPPRKRNFPAGTRCVKMDYEARQLMDAARERDWDWPQYVTKVW